MIEIIPIGGFSEIGRNSVAIKYGDESVILDLGLHMENYINLQEESQHDPSKQELLKVKAIPNYDKVAKGLGEVKAVAITHAHLDHVGATPYFLNQIGAPVHGSRFTINVLKAILKDKRIRSEPKLVEHPTDCTFEVSDNLSIQFVNITHSVPQTVAIVVHTPEGSVIYTPDYKLDNAPLLGDRPNYKAFKELNNVRALIHDSLYSLEGGKTPSESVAREMLRDVLLGTSTDDSNIVTTTFSSHIARLKTIVDLAESIGRKPVMIGRSLAKYVRAAKKSGIIDLESRAVDMVKYGGKLEGYFRHNKKTKDKLYMVTGHQGEPNAILSRMVQDDIFPFKKEDNVIFSCHIIPMKKAEENRAVLEQALRDKGIRVYKDIHVSGHARREDHRELINVVEPENIIPTHGDVPKLESSVDLAKQMGYSDDNVYVAENYEKIIL
jgi:ribonuclease J